MSIRLRVALCFFGLVKDYGLVADSVEQFVLSPLRKAGYEYDIYIHTYNQPTVTNPRNGEKSVSINSSSITKFYPTAIIRRDDPTTADRLHPLEYYLRNGDPWPDNPRLSMMNYIRQLYSLHMVTSLWWPSRSHYAYVVYLRPDVRFTSPLMLNPLIRERQIAIPNFHSFTGYNDRFAYGRPLAMKTYGDRLNWVEAFFARYKCSLHAESYLKFFLQAHGMEVILIHIHFVRVRANGQENEADRSVQPV